MLLPFFGAGRRIRRRIPVPHLGAGQSLRSPAPSWPRLRRKLPAELLKRPKAPGACGGGRQRRREPDVAGGPRRQQLLHPRRLRGRTQLPRSLFLQRSGFGVSKPADWEKGRPNFPGRVSRARCLISIWGSLPREGSAEPTRPRSGSFCVALSASGAIQEQRPVLPQRDPGPQQPLGAQRSRFNEN